MYVCGRIEEKLPHRTCHSLFPSVYVGYIYDGHEIVAV